MAGATVNWLDSNTSRRVGVDPRYEPVVSAAARLGCADPSVPERTLTVWPAM